METGTALARVMWDERLTRYDFGPGHPMSPVRLRLTMSLARRLGLLDAPTVQVSGFVPADDETLGLAHEPRYLAAVRACGAEAGWQALEWGLGTEDTPVFAGMHDAAALVVGASVAAAEAVWRGEARHALNIAGGLHHAMPAAASGFCVYNDVAVAIARLLQLGADRVAYVDIDVHHGDGVQHVFYNDPRVLTISVHESGRTLFPGTGFPYETGGPDAVGSVVNVALPAGVGDDQWLRAFHSVVPQLLAAFQPQVLVTQHGCDTHVRDPQGHLALSVDGQRMGHAALHRLAHEHAGGRWVATGGGGYSVANVVPRSWTHLIAEAAGRPIEPATETPEAWRAQVRETTGQIPPERMTDGCQPTVRTWATGFDPANEVDRAIMATRRAVFPSHGLDPLTD